tara:strand:+ start:91 stop:288 length:198 start_codon:yes stop_codon:yes gene_type:complete
MGIADVQEAFFGEKIIAHLPRAEVRLAQGCNPHVVEAGSDLPGNTRSNLKSGIVRGRRSLFMRTL